MMDFLDVFYNFNTVFFDFFNVDSWLVSLPAFFIILTWLFCMLLKILKGFGDY